MDSQPVLLIAFVAWQVVVALSLIILFRQTALISMRIGLVEGPSRASSTLVIGSSLPDEVGEIVPEAAEGAVSYLLWVTPSCVVCRDVVNEFVGGQQARPFPSPVTVLLTGDGDGAEEIERQISPWARVVREPDSSVVVGGLGLSVSPFVLETENSVITGWTGLRGLDDLWALHHARSSSDAHEFAQKGGE